MLSPHRVSHQLLSLRQVPARGGPVIQPRARQHIIAKRVQTHDLPHPRIDPTPLPMTRRREPISIKPVIIGQRIKQRRATVIHTPKLATTRPLLNAQGAILDPD